jgi:hypothetical protein
MAELVAGIASPVGLPVCAKPGTASDKVSKQINLNRTAIEKLSVVNNVVNRELEIIA